MNDADARAPAGFDGRYRPPSTRRAAATAARTRTLRLVTRAIPFQRLRRLSSTPGLRALLKPVSTGEMQIPGGMAGGLRLSAAHFSPGSAQAYHVLRGSHEPQVQEAIRRTLAPGGVFYDVGANIGLHSLVAALVTGADGAVVSIDPQRECVEAIRTNAAINRFEQIEVVHAAAGAHDGTIELIVTEDSLWSRTSAVGGHELEIRRDTVSSIALDTLALDGRLPPPSVVKIDVEGAEIDVLAGMTRLLAQVQPVVICEMHGRNAEFCEIMAKAGYRVVNLDSPEPVDEAPGNVHALAEPPAWRRAWPDIA